MSPNFFRTCSQVLTTSSENPFVHLIFIAVTWSSVSHVLIILYHLDLVSLSLCVDSLITHSHLNTHIRCAVSEMRMCRRWVAPLSHHSFRLLMGSAVCFAFRYPAPRIVPMSIVRLSPVCGHVFLARDQMMRVGLRRTPMWDFLL